MQMRLSLGLVLALGLADPVAVRAEAADCSTLAKALEDLTGYSLSSTLQPDVSGGCVASRVSFRRPDSPRLTAETLHLAGTSVEGELQSLDLAVSGMRLVADRNDRSLDERLRAFLRFQTADVTLALSLDKDAGHLDLQGGRVEFSGGTEVEFAAGIRAARLTLPSILLGSVVSFDAGWRFDGRLPAILMEISGERLVEGAEGKSAIDATATFLFGLHDSLPAASLSEESANAFFAAIAMAQHGRGKLDVHFKSETGLSAGMLALLALRDDPLSAASLAQILTANSLAAEWTPGLQP